MNRADARVLAWSLVDAASRYLSAGARASLNMKIGAGELDSAIIEMLTFFGDTKTAIARDLAVNLDAWIFGYTGTPAEGRFRKLLARIPLQDSDSQAPRSGGIGPRLATGTPAPLSDGLQGAQPLRGEYGRSQFWSIGSTGVRSRP
jgi:hypothetical protein